MTECIDLKALVLDSAPRRSMLSVCPEPGCTRLTMGGTCVEHDVPVTVTFPRGRPFTPGRAGAGQPVRVGSVPVP